MFARSLGIPTAWRVMRNLRFQSTSVDQSVDPVLVDVNQKNGIATVTMNQKPVNNMTLNFLRSFCDKMDLLEKEKVKGMILTSSLQNVFSSGLDFKELYKPDEARITDYWSTFQDSWLKLYGSTFPTVAMISGHAPAGGCVYALSCEYRVMLPNFTIGLNESPVGIVPPMFILELLQNVIGMRRAEMALTLGTLFTSEDALKIGLIDELAPNKDEALARSEAFLQKNSKIPATARSLTKQKFRQETLALLKTPERRNVDAKSFVDHMLLPSTQSDLENYVAVLKKSKK